MSSELKFPVLYKTHIGKSLYFVLGRREPIGVPKVRLQLVYGHVWNGMVSPDRCEWKRFYPGVRPKGEVVGERDEKNVDNSGL